MLVVFLTCAVLFPLCFDVMATHPHTQLGHIDSQHCKMLNIDVNTHCTAVPLWTSIHKFIQRKHNHPIYNPTNVYLTQTYGQCIAVIDTQHFTLRGNYCHYKTKFLAHLIRCLTSGFKWFTVFVTDSPAG